MRQPFFGPAPGRPLWPRCRHPERSTGIGPPGTFAVLRLGIERVDQLDRGALPHRRRVHRRTADGWSVEAVVA